MFRPARQREPRDIQCEIYNSMARTNRGIDFEADFGKSIHSVFSLNGSFASLSERPAWITTPEPTLHFV